MENTYTCRPVNWPQNLLLDLFPDGKNSMCETVSPPEMEVIVKYVLEIALSPRDEAILRMRYEKKLSLAEIGSQYALSHQRICQILKDALETLRTPTYAERLKRPSQEKPDLVESIDGTSGIHVLGLRKRLSNSLLQHGISTISHLMETDQKSLCKMRGIGKIGVSDIINALTSYGFDSSHLQK